MLLDGVGVEGCCIISSQLAREFTDAGRDALRQLVFNLRCSAVRGDDAGLPDSHRQRHRLDAVGLVCGCHGGGRDGAVRVPPPRGLDVDLYGVERNRQPEPNDTRGVIVCSVGTDASEIPTSTGTWKLPPRESSRLLGGLRVHDLPL